MTTLTRDEVLDLYQAADLPAPGEDQRGTLQRHVEELVAAYCSQAVVMAEMAGEPVVVWALTQEEDE